MLRVPSTGFVSNWDAGRLMGYFDRCCGSHHQDSWQPELHRITFRNFNQL
jgi:hypothetical protein